jgi:hypothetical protein
MRRFRKRNHFGVTKFLHRLDTDRQNASSERPTPTTEPNRLRTPSLASSLHSFENRYLVPGTIFQARASHPVPII